MNITARLAWAATGLLASLPVAMAAAPFTPAVQPTGWIARPIVTGPLLQSGIDVSSGAEVAYRSDYRVEDWRGNVQGRKVFSSGEVSPTALPAGWSEAATSLASLNWDTGRRIATMNGASRVAFRWANLSSAQQASLGDATTGPKVLNFIRGDRSNEDPAGAKFRARGAVLGDIVHSSVYYWDHKPGTATLKRLYVGANDGMLHVLDARTGAEVFGYVPSMLVPRLKDLASGSYEHSGYVDGQITMARVELSGVKTILVGSLGSGGKGLYALDVSDPTASTEAAAAAKIKWEVTPASTGYGNLGYVFGSARIARLNNGTAVAIVGNGYMNAGNGRSSLLIVNLDSGAKVAEIDTGSGSTTSPGGLSTPTLVDTDGDGKVEFAYAGDIDGKLWKFDLKTLTASLVFTTSPARAITVAPVVRSHPVNGYLVVFGTGRILSAGDVSTSIDNHVYGIWDGAPAAHTQLLSQSFEAEVTRDTRRFRSISSAVPNWSGASPLHKGWKLALPAGQHVVGESPFHHNGRYYFVSTNPAVSGGENWLNEVDFLSGGRPACPVFDLDEDGEVCSGTTPDAGDLVPDEGGKIAVSMFLRDGVVSQPQLVSLGGGFVSTIYNWNPDRSTAPGDFEDPVVTGGVSGGHFDFDAYALEGGKFKNKKHIHEYDDKYNVTGVNMLNASFAGFNLASFVPGTTTQFKVLVINQYHNPAARIEVGTGGPVSIRSYGGLAGKVGTTEVIDGKAIANGTTAQKVLDALPAYTRQNVGSLVFNLPLDAFKSQNWWGEGGDVRAGLIPNQTGCVNKVTASGGTESGPAGERYDGALTVQIIKSGTPATALELNKANDLRYGWRVKGAFVNTYVLAEYTAFWHHPNKKCHGEAGWVKNPAEDYSDKAKSETPAAGSTDPKGDFGSGNLLSDSSKTTVTAGVTRVVRTIKYVDGTVITVTTERREDGSVWKQLETNAEGIVTAFVCVENCGANLQGGFISPKQVPREMAGGSASGVRRESWREIPE